MLKFVDLKQENPLKRETKKRRQDFNEIYDEFINSKAKEQSSRCSQCGKPVFGFDKTLDKRSLFFIPPERLPTGSLDLEG